jgi:thioesterase domain-containing protein/acyl carrier protein
MIDGGASASTTSDVLTPIWERVLRRSPIGIDDNFFDLGGDSASANRLFAEIKRENGRELSPLTIFQAPTIAELAVILEKPSLPSFPALVNMKIGEKTPPIFVIPGLSGNLAEVHPLVKYVETQHPIYGLHPRGIDGLQEPFERVEDLAQFYLEAIQAIQPHGPYVFIGYSFGGLMASEMARRLSAKGETMDLLVMIESHPHWSYMPFGQKVVISKRRAKRLISKILVRTGLRQKAPAEVVSRDADDPGMGEKFTQVMRHAYDTANLTLRRYRPRHYKGRIHFIRAKRTEGKFADDPIAVWAPLSDDFVLDTVPGNHLGIVGEHSKSLAAVISRYLREISY